MFHFISYVKKIILKILKNKTCCQKDSCDKCYMLWKNLKPIENSNQIDQLIDLQKKISLKTIDFIYIPLKFCKWYCSLVNDKKNLLPKCGTKSEMGNKIRLRLYKNNWIGKSTY